MDTIIIPHTIPEVMKQVLLNAWVKSAYSCRSKCRIL